MDEESKSPDIVQEEELLTQEMLDVRRITSENAKFSATAGGFVSMDFDGKHYDRISVFRAFPFTEPERYISIRESDEKQKEIGIIEDLAQLKEEDAVLIRSQAEMRYFTPVIQKVRKIKEEYGYSYWDVETDRGHCTFTTDNNGVAKLSDTRLIISDISGNRFEIPDTNLLSTKEIKMVDLYI